MDITKLRELCISHNIEWTVHVAKRLLQRGLSSEDIEKVILSGEIIENYTDDYPFPSCLVLGIMRNNRALHVVCAIGDDKLWVITAYEPGLNEWEDGFKIRRR